LALEPLRFFHFPRFPSFCFHFPIFAPFFGIDREAKLSMVSDNQEPSRHRFCKAAVPLSRTVLLQGPSGNHVEEATLIPRQILSTQGGLFERKKGLWPFEITITLKEKFPIDEGLLSEEERQRISNLKREQKVQRKQVSLDEVDEAYDLVHDIPDSSLDPHQAALEKERIQLLHEELDKLPPDQAKVIDAVFFHGEKEKDIATEMGISQQSVSYLKKKALAKLRARLKNKI
jgi:RNA polymerase sigma factor (sigma-70 family)